jgi:bacterioferritin
MFGKSIELLNHALADELQSIRQYLKFHFQCSVKGMKTAAAMFMEIAFDEMRHAEMLTERILFLKGKVLLNTTCRITEAGSANLMLDLARRMEQKTISHYVWAANECGSYADPVSRRLFEELASEEVKHFHRFSMELHSIKEHNQENMETNPA